MKEIIITEQQIEMIKGFCLEILEGNGIWSKTTKAIASDLLSKLNEE